MGILRLSLERLFKFLSATTRGLTPLLYSTKENSPGFEAGLTPLEQYRMVRAYDAVAEIVRRSAATRHMLVQVESASLTAPHKRDMRKGRGYSYLPSIVTKASMSTVFAKGSREATRW